MFVEAGAHVLLVEARPRRRAPGLKKKAPPRASVESRPASPFTSRERMSCCCPRGEEESSSSASFTTYNALPQSAVKSGSAKEASNQPSQPPQGSLLPTSPSSSERSSTVSPAYIPPSNPSSASASSASLGGSAAAAAAARGAPGGSAWGGAGLPLSPDSDGLPMSPASQPVWSPQGNSSSTPGTGALSPGVY